ncbi:MAG: glucose-1-phosphate cytidylyltransferase [Pseudorhodoplanes sp.]|jgi:glucose-1-phosphate cytidylyltransferase|nr:glucose-1-phosphate cytidylyltransferase [Pseudorhodoplanes sp.]
MKVGILAGGFGTRLAEETEIRPKPMVEIGSMPILWHIMMHYYRYGHHEFAIALGYKGEYIKRWFKDYGDLNGSMTVRLATGDVKHHSNSVPDWSVDLIETGLSTLTGGRIKRLLDWMGNGTFMLTWGDGVSDVDLDKLVAFHRSHGKLATMTAVRPPARYGHIEFDGDLVADFTEKPQASEGWINGAFFVLEPGIRDYIDGDDVMFEHAPMRRLAADRQLAAYRHDSFWQCMDTIREKHLLQKLWDSERPPWKTWS